MRTKRWTYIVLITTAIILAFVVMLTGIIDPYFHYKSPSSDGYVIDNEIYQNPGIARHFDFDAVLIGSSMAQNFKTSEFDRKFGVTTAKLTYSAAYAKNYMLIMDIAAKDRDLKKVFWCMDIYSFVQPADETRYDLPDYLYDENLLNDVNYVLNKDIITQDLIVLNRKKSGIPLTGFDEAYEWYSDYINAFNVKTLSENQIKVRQKKAQPPVPEDEFFAVVKDNLDINILPVIEGNRDTEFIIFYPPYSILTWDNLRISGELNAYLYAMTYITETLLKCENVKLYSFQDVESIICDLTLYKDFTHYHPDINSLIVEELGNPEYVVTQKNDQDKMTELRRIIDETDLDALLAYYLAEPEG